MNRILVIVVLLLLPVTIIINNKENEEVASVSVLDNIKLEVPINNGETNLVDTELEEATQVLVSSNRDKSNPYYLDLEEYVIGVVAGEMPASFNMEALKAQAIASRTFAMYKMKNHKNYVLSTTINDQVYLTKEQMQKKWGSQFDYYYSRVKEAVLGTKGEVITYNNQIIIAYYFAISNGYTDSSVPVFNETRDYLVGVESPWDKNYQSYSSSRTIDKNSFCSKLGITCDDISISNVLRADNHYVREVVINNKKFTGKEVFNKLALKSMDFEISLSGNNVIIKTLGFGHGVGMSQYGAQGMAKEGYSYQDILKHYYQNTSIQNISSINL